jgi:hypothetical protein
MVAELSANGESNNGAFVVTAPSTTAAASVGFYSRGTTTVYGEYTNAAIAAPVTLVRADQANINGPSLTMRVNAAQVVNSSSSQGTGNYGNYPLFIGQRNQASLPFNGWLTQLIGVGAATSASQIVSTESWVNVRTGAY